MDIRTLSKQPNLSYFLLGKDISFILNPYARNVYPTQIFNKLCKYLPLNSFNVYLANNAELGSNILDNKKNKSQVVIVLGGDGTLNHVIQHLINTQVNIGIIPSGTANDMACVLNIPTDIEKALEIIRKGHIQSIDSVSMNNSHFVTIGSVGLPAFIAKAINKFKTLSRPTAFLHKKILKEHIYKLFTIFFTSHGSKTFCHNINVKINGKTFFEGQCVCVFIGKQEYLGKAFLACPGIKQNNEYFKVAILKYTGVCQAIKDVYKVSKGRSNDIKNFITANGNSFEIKADKMMDFLGDGEILDRDIVFKGKRFHRSLNIIVP